MATPLEIEVLLWHYYSPLPYPKNYPAHVKAFSKFVNLGLLIYNKDHSYPSYSLSEGGYMYVEQLKAVPFPRKVWAL